MLMIRRGKAARKTGVISRSKPARTTSSIPAARNAATTARSNSSRLGKPRWSMTRVAIPAAVARRRPAASARFDTTSRRSQSSRFAATRSMIAWRLVPAPEINAPTAITRPFIAATPAPSRGPGHERREMDEAAVALDRSLAMDEHAEAAEKPGQLARRQDEGWIPWMPGQELIACERLEQEQPTWTERAGEAVGQR